ncbi:MAG TPA: hypothetical protein ENI68_12305 [Gammaproteobacteria bacterium]|nr:hypothetical protein [Gammaproteobacteria bacterium]
MKSVLIYTVHKAASMFLHKLGADMGKRLELDTYSINNKKYYDQIKNSSWKLFIESTTGPSCFGPIRAGEDVALPVFPDNMEKYSVVLHIRDPRDVLTSAYYSHAYSHVVTDRFKPSSEQRKQWEEEGVDHFVINRIERVKKEYEELCTHLLDKDNVVLIKYEDMVTNYEKWLKGFVSAFSEFEPRQKAGIGLILGKNTHEKIYTTLYNKYKDDFLPAKEEDVYSHKRQVTPGDYARKLEKSTIETLNNEFSGVLTSLRY